MSVAQAKSIEDNQHTTMYTEKEVTEKYKSLQHTNHIKAKEIIKQGKFSFYLRNKKQQEYHPDNIQTFTDKRFKVCYVLQDMACLCTSNEVANYIAEMATRIRDSQMTVSDDDLRYVVEFIRKGKEKYSNTDYIDLEKIDQESVD